MEFEMSSDMGAASGIIGAMVGVLLVMYVVLLALSIVMLVAEWKMFKKAGEHGWAAIVPFYNTYTLFKIANGDGWRMLFMLVPFYNIYICIKLYIDLAKAYGKEPVFAVGLIFLSPIFICILGFGKCGYVGPKGVPDVAATVGPVGNTSAMSNEDMRAALREKMQNK